MVNALAAGGPAPSDGILVVLLRLLLKYPEILAWETLFHESREAVARLPHELRFEVGATIHLTADAERVFLFDSATGARIR